MNKPTPGLIHEVPLILKSTLPTEVTAKQMSDALALGMWRDISARGEERIRMHLGDAHAHIPVRELHQVFEWLIGPKPEGLT